MIWLPVAVSALILILLIFVIRVKYPGKLPSAMISVGVTTVSVLLGLTSGLAVFEYTQDVKDRQAVERLSALLSAELSGLRSHLEFDHRPEITVDGEQVEFRVLGLRAEILKKAGRSGLFDVEESHQMLELAQSIDAWNRKTEGLIGAINADPESDLYTTRIRWYMKNQEASTEGLLKGIEWLENELELKRWPTIRY